MALDFVDEFCSAYAVRVRRVHPDLLACLKRYPWPGNVRELKNHIRRAVLFCRTGELSPSDLAPHIAKAASREATEEPIPPPARPPRGSSLLEQVAASERAILEQALAENNQNRTVTAKALGLSRVGLYKKMKKYGMIDAPRPAP